jgi:hypothetical protein
MRDRTTRDFPSAPTLVLPIDCITATALHSLARALERLAAFHRERGGAAPDAPCLTHVMVEDRGVIARVRSGDRTYKLLLVKNDWEFR